MGDVNTDPVEVGDVGFLVSYHYARTSRAFIDIMTRVSGEGHPLMLDSGAYSAHTQDAVIDVETYTEYCLEHGDLFNVIVALDVIGDGEASRDNWRKQIAAGVDALPVWHHGDDPKLLDEYCEATNYVGLGGLVGAGSDNQLRFCSYAMHRHPDTLFHGLGVTRRPVVFLPFHSVDSTSAISVIAYNPGVWSAWDPAQRWPVVVPKGKLLTRGTEGGKRLGQFVPLHDGRSDSDAKVSALVDAWGRAGKVLRGKGSTLYLASSNFDLINRIATAIESSH